MTGPGTGHYEFHDFANGSYADRVLYHYISKNATFKNVGWARFDLHRRRVHVAGPRWASFTMCPMAKNPTLRIDRPPGHCTSLGYPPVPHHEMLIEGTA